MEKCAPADVFIICLEQKEKFIHTKKTEAQQHILSPHPPTFSTFSLPDSHDVILYHGCQFIGERGEAAHAQKPTEKANVTDRCSNSSVLPSRRERERSNTTAFSTQHLYHPTTNSSGEKNTHTSPPKTVLRCSESLFFLLLKHVRGQRLWKPFKKIQTRLSGGAKW